MKKLRVRCATIGCLLLAFSLTPCSALAQVRGEQFGHQKTSNLVLEGPAIRVLISEQLTRQDIRKLVTDPHTVQDHPDLISYYRSTAQRLLAESKQYERFAREAGDNVPLTQPNHYGFGRTARFDYIAARDLLKKARNAQLLAAVNAQAAQREGCFACHSFHGRGGTIGPDLALEGRRKRSDAWLTRHLNDPQANFPNSPMPAFANLSDRQLKVLSAFLEFQK